MNVTAALAGFVAQELDENPGRRKHWVEQLSVSRDQTAQDLLFFLKGALESATVERLEDEASGLSFIGRLAADLEGALTR